jgi:hypothetical protein
MAAIKSERDLAQHYLEVLRYAPQLPAAMRSRLADVETLSDRRLVAVVIDPDGAALRVVGHIIGPPADVMIDGKWWRVQRVSRSGPSGAIRLAIEMERIDG